MWLSSFLAIVLLVCGGLCGPSPGGLLRVPKVYNAVITSNQNLAPSRAYPVIQPVVHRTAIGYVPPFYYAHLAPGFVGPEVVPLDPGVLGSRGGGRGGGEGDRREGSGPPSRPGDVESVEASDSSTGPNSPPPPKKVARPNSTSRDVESSAESTESSERRDDGKKGAGKNDDRVPLSFYPNYQSLYYDPYFYPYNAFPPHLAAPGTYYVDYPQPPPGILGPLPPPPLPIGPGRFPVPPAERPRDEPEEGNGQESSRRAEKQQKLRASGQQERREKIPDVPPPPLPTVVRKKAS